MYTTKGKTNLWLLGTCEVPVLFVQLGRESTPAAGERDYTFITRNTIYFVRKSPASPYPNIFKVVSSSVGGLGVVYTGLPLLIGFEIQGLFQDFRGPF